ncbi:MAG: alpha/beta hydrolase [Pseudomonadota bacterium]
MSGAPLRWSALGRDIAGLSWGPATGRKILALHGWLDHADSFSVLAPLLSGCHVVAVDKPGHGDSAHRPPDGSYNLWDDLRPLFGVMDALEWEGCTLLGHSRGAMTATLMAAARPDRVDALLCYDAMLPSPVADADFVSQLRKHLDDMARLSKRPKRVYADTRAFLRRRMDYGNSEAVARALANRALRPVEGGYAVCADPRLQAASAVKMNDGQIDAVLSALDMPVLSLWAADGLGQTAWAKEIQKRARKHVRRLETDTVPGDHHGHLDLAHARGLADRILRFLADYPAANTS